MRIGREANVAAHNIYASFDEAVTIAKQMEPEVDAILSRGGTADYIKRSVDIPVIFIPITPFDVIQVVHSIDRTVGEVALYHFKSNIHGVRDIERMYGIKLREYTFLHSEDIIRGIEDAKARGIITIIGGEVACKLAAERGMIGYELGAGEAAVHSAFKEALQILFEKEKERGKTVQLKAAFDSIAEGVIVTDDSQRVVICNPAVGKILGVRNAPVVGQQLSPEISDEQFKNVFLTHQSKLEYIRQVNAGTITSSHRPIFLDSKFVGVVSTFQDITHIQKLENKIRHEVHAKGFVARNRFEDILTVDPDMQNLKKMASLYARSSSTILIEGESGTGKELFAQSLHNASLHADGPFVAINCAAIPENLLESELFGYEAGAFTGAKREGRQGLFELAHGGTIFLDEVGEIPTSLQARLLRVIQEKEVMRIGGDRIVPVNVRIISASNKNLRKMTEAGEFREDLYYRLNVFCLRIPPLRERKGDVRLLSEFFLRQSKTCLAPAEFENTVAVLEKHLWPGNMRELQNVVERIRILKMMRDDSLLSMETLEEVLGLQQGCDADFMTLRVKMASTLKDTVEQVERFIVGRMMITHANDYEKVMRQLGIGRTTLWRKYREKLRNGEREP